MRPALRSRILTIVALLAVAVWLGGLTALGAVAAPVVFSTVPWPSSADAMTIVFRRFDAVAMACAAIVLATEAARAMGGPGVRARRSRPRARFAARSRGGGRRGRNEDLALASPPSTPRARSAGSPRRRGARAAARSGRVVRQDGAAASFRCQSSCTWCGDFRTHPGRGVASPRPESQGGAVEAQRGASRRSDHYVFERHGRARHGRMLARRSRAREYALGSE